MRPLLSKLVTFQTYTGNSTELEACFNYLETSLARYDLHVSRMSSNGLPSLVATTQPTKSPKVLLQAHIDVVPGKLPSFKLLEKDGRYYGRGVFDMKFAAACYLKLVDHLKDSLAHYDFGIMFTSDEEIGGKNGVSYLLDQGYSTDICVLPDGGNDLQIETTCNAIWIARLSATGKSAHGSRPWEGLNAINTLVEGLNDIRESFGRLEPFKNSVTISKIQGGTAMNQVPDSAEAVVDMRFINNSEANKYAQTLKKITSAHGLQLETIASVKARNIDVSQPEVASFLAIAEKITGSPITKTHSFGASDACYFASHGIPTIVIRPRGDGAHSDHEWIDKAGLLQFYELIKTYVMQTTSVA